MFVLNLSQTAWVWLLFLTPYCSEFSYAVRASSTASASMPSTVANAAAILSGVLHP